MTLTKVRIIRIMRTYLNFAPILRKLRFRDITLVNIMQNLHNDRKESN